MPTVYTIGHGNRLIQELLDLLAAERIERLVDIRAYPGSRRQPQFRREALRARLKDSGIVYRWMGDAFGGRRAPHDESPHVALAAGVRGFADHMQTRGFRTAIDDLLVLSRQSKIAVMCAEKAPEHCHRLLLADYLVLRGNPVTHLIDCNQMRDHRISLAARPTANGMVYDRNATRELDL